MDKSHDPHSATFWQRCCAILLFGVIAATLALVTCDRTDLGGSTPVRAQNEVFETVIGSGQIRCAYVVYPPGCMKDPNTGRIYGIMVDTVVEAAKELGLEIEWTDEVGWGTMIEGLKTRRYDLVVSGIWPSAARAKHVDFTVPLFYSGIGIYVRTGDGRFTGKLDAINSEEVKIATIDGEMTDIIARTQFPKAQRVSLPQLSDVAQVLLNVANRRADVTFVEPIIAYQYLQNNPGTLEHVARDQPIRVFGNTCMFLLGEVKFKAMLNNALEELLNRGFVDQLIDKYEPAPGLLYGSASRYRSRDQ